MEQNKVIKDQTKDDKKTKARGPRTPVMDERRMKNEKNLDTKKFNAFLIRETYVYMAKIDRIPNATNRLYKYLGVDEDYYNHLIRNGAGDINRIKNKLAECGFSDTLFRSDSATRIRTSKNLERRTESYFMDKSEYSLGRFREFFDAEIGSIRNPDNTLLVVATRNLLNKVVQASDPDDTLLHFLDILEDMDYEGHATQKGMAKKIQDIYDEYLGLIEDNKNITEK